MKPFWLNLLTLSLTVALLVALALPAKRSLDAARESRRPCRPRRAVAAPGADPRRAFGVYVDPWHVDDWARSVGAAPQLVGQVRGVLQPAARSTAGCAQVERIGIRRMLVSWEPWAPVPAALGHGAQARPQPGYRNLDIARGAQDRYILRFARSLARFRGIVYLRFAHEMNGYWYPWSRGPRAYVYAWRRIVRIFDVAGARNVRFVWSVNPNLYESQRAWRRGLRAYWPGSRYVDAVGSTMIDFGGVKSYPVAPLRRRGCGGCDETFGKPLVLTEVNTAYAGRVRWLADLRRDAARDAVDRGRRLVAAAEPRQGPPGRHGHRRLGRRRPIPRPPPSSPRSSATAR